MKHLVFAIKKELKNNFLDYLILITFGVFFLILTNLFKGERFMEFILLLTFVGFYILWGTYHHLTKNSFRLKIVVEYILIGFLVLFLLKIILII
jgi:hypothetical protein